jgi:hypothetical protein
VVDGFDLHHDGQTVDGVLTPTEAGHTAYHKRAPLSVGI